MSGVFVESDLDILEYLRSAGPATVSELARHFSVTPTAVRQRLGRLVAEGLVERSTHRQGRGRPRHVYRITGKGRLRVGSNYADLACALWHGIRKVPDKALQRQILVGVAEELARMYLPQMSGFTLPERMGDVVRIFGQRRLPFYVENVSLPQPNSLTGKPSLDGEVAENREGSGPGLNGQKASQTQKGHHPYESKADLRAPALVAAACPYPDLADADPSICEFERIWLSELLGTPVSLTQCRIEGSHQCRFEAVLENPQPVDQQVRR